ncbi:MAG: hypothetical protein MUF47_13555 [Porphyrobacter sp.]|nr:hypothetical protein [Porphyrobacter sp.]
MSAMPSDYPRIPLSQFRTNTDEVLHLATVQPVVLISHGCERHMIADIQYFRRLEEVAGGAIAAQMSIEAIAASQTSKADQQALANAQPTVSEIAKDCWEQ